MTKTLRGSDADQSHFQAKNVVIIGCGFDAMPAPVNPKGSGDLCLDRCNGGNR